MHTTTGSIFNDLGFNDGSSALLIMKSMILHKIQQAIVNQELTIEEAANKSKISETRMRFLLLGKLHLFTVSRLVGILDALKAKH